MKFEVTILGSSAAIPTTRRNPSAQILNIHGRLVLIDCAEGTQLQLTRFGIPIQKITQIFISHMHGDHYYGLVGLISKFHLLGRKKDLDLFGPAGLIDIIELNLHHSNTSLNFKLNFHPLPFGESNTVFKDSLYKVRTVPLNHSVPTNGFLFEETIQPRKIRKDFLSKRNLAYNELRNIKEGMDYTDPEGNLYMNSSITSDPPVPRSYAYLTDTGFHRDVIPIISRTDLLYHEATFADDMENAAADRLHSTARQAAIIAKEADVRKLIIGHFSARYKDAALLLAEAREEFPETYIAEDGMAFEVNSSGRQVDI